ncbi:hypothetical protein [Streptomyces albus]|uniref:hypothetical protein n=1 Tax=Streptomyces albus TaxID=1888 RepID=UPI00131AF317|nr:hypothetical protein [Streptomyces albus]
MSVQGAGVPDAVLRVLGVAEHPEAVAPDLGAVHERDGTGTGHGPLQPQQGHVAALVLVDPLPGDDAGRGGGDGPVNCCTVQRHCHPSRPPALRRTPSGEPSR